MTSLKRAGPGLDSSTYFYLLFSTAGLSSQAMIAFSSFIYIYISKYQSKIYLPWHFASSYSPPSPPFPPPRPPLPITLSLSMIFLFPSRNFYYTTKHTYLKYLNSPPATIHHPPPSLYKINQIKKMMKYTSLSPTRTLTTFFSQKKTKNLKKKI